MKFGRRNSWVEVGRRLLAERFAEQDEALIQEERNALLQVAQGLPETPVEAHMDERAAAHVYDADPTQMLLTVLGRFNRAVAKAESNPQGNWTDECIEQIVAGIEIAVRHRWDNLREALTDTARMLQTYEDADIPYEAVYFLKDSYEILCLMVGDLIVDNVRSGAMNKWRERYHLAVKELERFGLEPIPDEMPEEAPLPATPANAPARGQIIPFGVPQRREDSSAFNMTGEIVATPVEDLDEAADEAAMIGDDTPYVPEVPEEEMEAIAAEDEARVYVADEPLAEPEEEPALWSLPQETATEEVCREAAEDEAIAQEMLLFEETLATEAATEMEDERAVAQAAALEASPREAARDEALAEEGDIDEDALETAEALTESGNPEPAAQSPIAEAMEIEDLTPEQAEAAAADALAALAPGNSAHAAEAAREDDLFSGIEDMAEEETAAEDDVVEESTAPAMASAPMKSPAPSSSVPPAEGTPEHLLYSAQAAMARGDIASAKLLALQVAADMARLEAERAAVELGRAKTQREETRGRIQAAQREVSSAEASLGARLQARATQERALAAKRAEIRGIEESIAEIEQGIRQIEEQIALLQARREAEIERLGEAQAVDAAERREEARLLEDIGLISAQEQEAEQALRAARGRVAALEEELDAREADILEAESALASRLEAVADIDGTMNHMRTAAGV